MFQNEDDDEGAVAEEEHVCEQNEPAQRRQDKAGHEEDETTGLGPKSNTDAVTMADAGLSRSGPATMAPATSGTETVPADEQREGHEKHEAGE